MAERAPNRRRVIVSVARVVARAALLLLLVIGLVGHALRDRNLLLELMMYVPLVPVGLAVALADVLARGRCLPRLRFGALVAGLATAAWGTSLKLGGSPPSSSGQVSGGSAVTVIHWNTRWGNPGGIGPHLSAIVDKVRREAADIVVLSEAPNEAQVAWIRQQLGGTWTHVQHVNLYPNGYAIKLVVLSPWRLTHDGVSDITDGQVLFATADVNGRPIRVAVVDGRSEAWLPRRPRLRDALRVCQARQDVGQRVDVIAGDFNSLSRSIGFDAWREGGYTLASDVSAEWRGTWHRRLPLYDVDHVWLCPGATVIECDMFFEGASDHRGQTVRVYLAD
jgi:endonuclease/exonuclease/phosphatase (EEP) superfamily protein YafD